MKTQIIQLEPHDDVISVKDKMGWSQTPRILLVWPVRGKILNRRLDLVFLERHTFSLGAQLALVSRDRDVRFHAKRLGIPLYTSVRKAEKSQWRRPRRARKRAKRLKSLRPSTWDPSSSTADQRSVAQHTRRGDPEDPRSDAEEQRSDEEFQRMSKEDLRLAQSEVHPAPPAWIRNPITRLVIFTLGVIAILSIAAILVPRADIHLNPLTHWDEVSIPVEASPNYRSITISGRIPAHWTSVIVEGRDTLPTSGSTSIPNQSATGTVTFSNFTDQTVLIPKGLVVSTSGPDPVRFTTTRKGSLPPGADQTTTLPIQALIPGSGGNVPPESIIAVEGPLGLELTVTNPRPTHGGSDRTAPAPSQRDYQEIYNQMIRSLRQTALEELKVGLESDDLLLNTTLTIDQTLVETYNPPDVQPADQLNLTLRLEYKALVVFGDDLKSLARSVLEEKRPNGQDVVPNTLEIEHISAPLITNRAQAEWQMNAKWQLETQINPAKAVMYTLGLPPNQAEDQLANNLPLATPPKITLIPDWWPRLPVIPFRIQVSH